MASMRAMPRWLLASILGVTVLRGLMAATLGLSDDEAYYRLWTLSPAMSYLDHPPMAAWMMTITRWIAGDTTFGLRLPSLLISLAGPFLLWRTALILFDRQTAVYATTFALVMPLLAVGGIIITPDAPSVLFWGLVAWALAELHVSRNANWWLAVGLFAGAGLVSKYTNLFVGAGILVYILLVPRNRSWLASWQLWAGGLIAVACTLPVVAWNARYEWASFAKQFGRVGRGSEWTLSYVLEMLGGYIGLASPLIAVLSLIGLARILNAAIRTRDERAILVISGLGPMLAYFVAHGLHARVQANWLAALYPALALCAAYQLKCSASAHKRSWFAAAAGLGVAMTALTYVHALRPFVLLPGARDPTSQLRGWREVAEIVNEARRQNGAGWIATASYGAAGQLAFALKDAAVVEQITERIRYVQNEPVDPELARKPALVFDLDNGVAVRVARANFKSVQAVGEVQRHQKGVVFATYRLYLARDPIAPDVLLKYVKGRE